MRVIDFSNYPKATANQAVSFTYGHGGVDSNEASGQAALFDEFAALLDKIAIKVSHLKHDPLLQISPPPPTTPPPPSPPPPPPPRPLPSQTALKSCPQLPERSRSANVEFSCGMKERSVQGDETEQLKLSGEQVFVAAKVEKRADAKPVFDVKPMGVEVSQPEIVEIQSSKWSNIAGEEQVKAKEQVPGEFAMLSELVAQLNKVQPGEGTTQEVDSGKETLTDSGVGWGAECEEPSGLLVGHEVEIPQGMVEEDGSTDVSTDFVQDEVLLESAELEGQVFELEELKLGDETKDVLPQVDKLQPEEIRHDMSLDQSETQLEVNALSGEDLVEKLTLALREKLSHDEARRSEIQDLVMSMAKSPLNLQLPLENVKSAIERLIPEISSAPHWLQQMMDVVLVKATAPSAPVQNLSAVVPAVTKQTAEFPNQEEGKVKARALPAAHTVRTLAKVEAALKEIASSKDGKTISVRLDPPSLGTVRVDLSLRDGTLHARIGAENPAVSQMLRERSQEIHQILRRLNLNVDKVNVSISSLGQDGEDRGGAYKSIGQESSSFEDQRRRYTSLRRGSEQVFWGGRRVSLQPRVYDHWVA